MWHSIHHNRRQSRKHSVAIRKISGAAAVFICVLLIGGIGANAAGGGRVVDSIRHAGGGKVIDSIKELCGLEPESVEIIQNMTPEMEVYAPPLLDCNERRVIFATSRGMVIYDRIEQRTIQTIDLQEIGCNYFTTDSLTTKVLADGNQIQIFNVKNGKVQGNCYRYEIPEHSDTIDGVLEPMDAAPAEDARHQLSDAMPLLEPVEITAAEDALLQQWEQKMSGRFQDTFDLVGEDTIDAWHSSDEPVKYSEAAVSWSKNQEAYFSCLLLKGKDWKEYQLYSWNQASGESQTEPLQITVSGEAARQSQDANALPKFIYTGDDAVLKAVCSYLVEEEADPHWKSPLYALIPAPVIYDTVKEDGVTKVFGNFWHFYYYKNGNTLEDDGGGEMPMCIHLKEENGAFTVAQVEETGDGAYYAEGIQKFCEGHPDIYQRFFDYENNQMLRDKIRKELLEQYVTDNQLDIRYYHSFGWDPVELFAEDE